jgi:hypothetical protein
MRRAPFVSLLAFTILSCGGEAVAPPHPAAIEPVNGDNQSGDPGQLLPLTLDVIVFSSTGGPMQEARVDWTVTSGGGTLSRTATNTDDGGQSSVSWTLGPTPGPQTVTATVGSGATHATFTATANAPSPPPPPPPGAPIIFHFDGNVWSSSMTAQGAIANVSAVWSAPSITFAAATGCSGRSMLEYYSGVWHPETCTNDGLVVASLWGFTSTDVYAVELYRNRLIVRDNIYHFSGQTWDPVFTRTVSDVGADGAHLRAIGGRNAYDVIAVGDSGKIVRGDGLNWLTQQSPTTKDLHAVWGDPISSAAFAVGKDGTIIYFDGTQWQTQTSGTNQTLLSVWGSAATDVFAVGANGTILHYDGTSWSAQSSGSTQQLNGVWGTSGNSVFAVGTGSTILHYDGSRWAAQTVSAPISFAGVSGTSSSDVFAVGTPF